MLVLIMTPLVVEIGTETTNDPLLPTAIRLFFDWYKK